MSTCYVLYNTKAGIQNTAQHVRQLIPVTDTPLKYIDILDIRHYDVFLAGLEPEDTILIAGGDGTLHHFINNTQGIAYSNEVYYFPNGTGNDFAHDLGHCKGAPPFRITPYIKNLPQVQVNGKQYLFLNGVGYGIDGYCCEVGDELRKRPGKKVNYTAIAIKGLLLHYKPTAATVTVDGKTRHYDKVWIAPTMNGRFYGGGMMPTPDQARGSGLVSTMVLHDVGKLKTLLIFPTIFSGQHTRHAECVDVFSGHTITVEFDRPTALQIDGETITNVRSYTVMSGVPSPIPTK